MKSEFASLFDAAGQARIKSLSFKGQKRLIEIDDPEVLAAFEVAMRTSHAAAVELGLTYEVRFHFMSGRSLSTFVYVHEDKGGLTIANPTVMRAGDPMMVSIRFQPPMNAKLGLLMDALSN